MQSRTCYSKLTVDMSHLPVRDVHLLVVAWLERKHHHISSSKDPINICLHILEERWKNLTKWESKSLSEAPGSAQHLVYSNEALGV